MFFSHPPKIKRVANHLKSQLEVYCQERWSHYLVVAEKYGYKNLVIEAERATCANLAEIFEMSPWTRPKEHFSWQPGIEEPNNVTPMYAFQNAQGQYRYYRALLERANLIAAELDKNMPNYREITRLAIEINNSSTTVPSIIEGGAITLEVSYFSGNNLFIDLISGIGGLIYAPLAFLAGVLASPFIHSHYFGTSAFFLDTAIYFADSLGKIISNIAFPIAMLYGKYNTDSCNIIKGDLLRCVDSLLVLTDEHSNVELDSTHAYFSYTY